MALKGSWRTLVSGIVLATCIGPALAQAPGNQAAAVVNGESIPMGELKNILEQRPSPVPLTAEQQQGMKKMALDMLIDDILMRQYLKKIMPPVTPAEVNEKIMELSDALKKQNKTLPQFLKDGGQTEAQLRIDIAAQLQWRNYLKKSLPDQSLKSYYDANKIFFDKVMVKASHILIRLRPDATPAEQQAAMAKMQTIRQEILTNKIDFAEAAKKYSECPSKAKGGDIGPFPYKFAVVEPFAQTAFAMKIGDVSEVVKTDFGLHLIKVTDRIAGEPSNFANIKEFVRDVYAQDLDLYQKILTDQRKSAKIEVYAN